LVEQAASAAREALARPEYDDARAAIRAARAEADGFGRRAQTARQDLEKLQAQQADLERELPADLHERLADLIARQTARRREIGLLTDRELAALTTCGPAIEQLQRAAEQAVEGTLQAALAKAGDAVRQAQSDLLTAVSAPLDRLREAGAMRGLLMAGTSMLAQLAMADLDVIPQDHP
jgi:hypothetical protein